jgi:NAD(P)-dependent dehydrogenase (short-subunit alcohol dehydrogenase family)
MRRFDGQVVLITGGTSGIGRAAALAWAGEGAKVVVTGRRDAEGQETLRLIGKADGEGCFVQGDVSNESDVRRMVQAAVDRFGRLDAAFNNAGVEEPSASFVKQTEDNFDRVVGVNFKGVWLCMKHEIEAMLKTGSGAIVNNSSVGGLVGMAYNAIYSATKHAVCGLTKSAALEFAPKGIRVNAIAPGGVQTELLDRVTSGPESEYRAKMIRMHPVRRLATTDEIAAAVLWLCSKDASFVHGHILSVDGGFTAR